MKIIILAGGYGTRLSGLTDSIPKPMVEIGGIPIIVHIMRTYAKYNLSDFYIALGYKAKFIKEYFLNYQQLSNDFTVNLSNGSVKFHSKNDMDWNVSLVETGLSTMTGGRVKRLKKYIGNEPFLLTYGDGLSDLNINNLIKFHKEHKKMVTLTAVRPSARFGEIEIVKNKIISFKEKPQLNDGWINGGYFVINPEFFELIDSDDEMLEQGPIQKVIEMDELMAFKHDGFWQCMDTKRDHELLEKLWIENPPWPI